MPTDLDGTAARVDAAAPAAPPRRFRRRQYLLDRKHQFRAGAWTALAVTALLVLLNASLYGSNRASSAFIVESIPELRDYIVAQDRAQMSLAIVGSIVFVAGVFALSIVETNRTAGPAWRIHEMLLELEKGGYGRQVRLRKGDNLWSLARAFNAVSSDLRSRALEDIETLENLASRIEQAGADARMPEVAERLRMMARDKSALLG